MYGGFAHDVTNGIPPEVGHLGGQVPSAVVSEACLVTAVALPHT